MLNCGDMGGDDNEGSSIEKRVAPRSTLGRGEDGRGGDETGTGGGGGGARVAATASAKGVICGFSDISSSVSDPGEITAVAAGGGGGGGRANQTSVN